MSQAQDIIDISQHHIVLHKMGFRLLDFDYVLPTPQEGDRALQILTVYLTSLIPLLHYEKGDRHYLPNTLIRSFVEQQWKNAFGSGQLSTTPEELLEYQTV
jgi:hypothetical protein